jgi:hypothetical protein
MAKTGPNDASGVVLGPRYAFFFPLCFLHTNKRFLNYLLGSICLEGTRKVRVGNDNQTGPNDVSGVVWALGMFSFVFLALINVLLCIYKPGQKKRPAMMNIGPNDASGVVLGLRYAFFPSCFFTYQLMIFILFTRFYLF